MRESLPVPWLAQPRCSWRLGIYRNRLGLSCECRRSVCRRRQVFAQRGRRSCGDSYQQFGRHRRECDTQGNRHVNADCTGTFTVGVYASGSLVRTATFDVVYVAGGREARAIIASLVLANGTVVPSVLTVDARKVFECPRANVEEGQSIWQSRAGLSDLDRLRLPLAGSCRVQIPGSRFIG